MTFTTEEQSIKYTKIFNQIKFNIEKATIIINEI